MADTLEGEFILNADSEKKEEGSAKPALSKNNLHNKSRFYSSFCEYPEGFKFSEQESDEEIVLLLRRHFSTNVPWILGAFLLSLIPPIFPFVVASFPVPLPSVQTLFLYTLFYYLGIIGFVILNFSLWYFHTGIITNKRIMDIDLAGLLFRQISESKIRNIEEVTYKQVGFISSLFNYGDVYVQTAGEEINIEFDRVPRPSKVADIISDLTIK